MEQWRYLLSFFGLRKEQDPPRSTSEDSATSAKEVIQRDELVTNPPARHNKTWLRRKKRERQHSLVTPSEIEIFKNTNVEATFVDPDKPLEGYGSYYMPCCPCSGHLSDQPCMPKWCFTYKYLDWLTISALIFLFCWGTLLSVNPTIALPKGALFTLALAAILAYSAGFMSLHFMRLPPTLFMFVVGFLFTNSPLYKDSTTFGVVEIEAVTAFILTVMSTKAALYFDMKVFKKYPITILLVGIIPCACEISAVGGFMYAVCHVDLITAFSMATVLANVSSVVMSHSLVTLARVGYGARTGILSILMAAAPIDSLIVLTILGVLVGDDNTAKSGAVTFGLQVAGIASGAFLGAVFAFFPVRNNMNATVQRTMLHILSIMGVQVICHAENVFAVGHLFNTAAACATINCLSLRNWTIEVMLLKDIFEMIWHGLQPIAVILACSMIDFKEMNVGMLWQSFAVFFMSYVLRLGLVYLCTQFSGKPTKQRIFMSMCWTARGLTQGILTGTLINFVKKHSTPQQTRDILTIFTVNLIVGNVVSNLQIWYLGPKLLPKNDPVSKA